MSEKTTKKSVERKNPEVGVAAEETCAEQPKRENWFKRVWRSPKVRKGLRVSARIAESVGLLGLGVWIGRGSSPKSGNCCTAETPAATTSDDDELDDAEL